MTRIDLFCMSITVIKRIVQSACSCSGRQLAVAVVVMATMSMCFHFNAYSQSGNNQRKKNNDSIILIDKIAFNKLPVPQRKKSAVYKNYLDSQNVRMLYPYYPYVVISFKYLRASPVRTVRMYLGKLTSNVNANDFILIAVNCKETKRKNTLNKEFIMYVDDSVKLESSSMGSVIDIEGFSIRVKTGVKSKRDTVFYHRILRNQITNYRDNFKAYIKSTSLDLNTFPVCFIVKKRRNTTNLQIQPVIGSKKLQGITSFYKFPASSGSGGTRNLKKFNFADDVIILFQGIDTCCQTPPEEGNSVKD